MLTAEQENIRTLARLVGISEEEAAQKLAYRVAISAAGGQASEFARYLAEVAGMTLHIAGDGEDADLEFAVNITPAGRAPIALVAAIDAAGLRIGRGPLSTEPGDTAPPLALKIAACYAAGVLVANAIGGDRLEALPDPFEVQFSKLGLVPELFANPIALHDTVLIGAGGVGNGFIWAAEGFDLNGELDVADPKTVGLGNLNRCHYFSEDDLDQNKAEVLCTKAPLPKLKLVPFVGTFKALREQRKRIKRVIVTVDSRPARRSIQSELPLEVLDASTTDVSGVVVHSHAQPTAGACLSCIYKHIPREDEQARSIAEGLGITVEEVRQELIDSALAQKLAGLHPALSPEALEGRALTTLYKELCGAQALKSAAGEQALAPFAFVSHLAGALLFLELLRFEAGIRQSDGTNYLNLDPWQPPHGRARRVRGKMPDCEFCGDPSNLDVLSTVWSDILVPEKTTA